MQKNDAALNKVDKNESSETLIRFHVLIFVFKLSLIY